MSVRPDDLANLCALYLVLGARTITPADVERYVQKSMLIDSTASASQIIGEATNCGLLTQRPPGYSLTVLGLQLGKRQKQVNPQISESAKDFLIKKVYLNLDSGVACCSDFLTRFRADTVQGTFVFDRHDNETPEEIRWLRTLSKVNLLAVEIETAKVNLKYLDTVNEFLAKIRGKSEGTDLEPGVDRDKIGHVAEECALQYEKQRLKKCGHPDLAMLVQRISLVDKTAGYDILSYRGTGKKPDSRIFIEVKGTMKDQIDFIWSRNERFIAHQQRKNYWIYAFTNVEIEKDSAVGPVRINDPIANLELLGFSLESLAVHVRQ